MTEVTREQTVLRLGTAALFALVSIYVLTRSLGLGYWTDIGPGPGFFPFWSAVVILVCLAGWLWNYLKPPSSEHDEDTILGLDADLLAEQTSDPSSAADVAPSAGVVPQRWHLLVVVASLVVVSLVLVPLGFQLAMFLFLLFHLRVLGGTGRVLSLLVAAGGSFGVFVLFTEVLRVGLPTAGIGLLRGLGL